MGLLRIVARAHDIQTGLAQDTSLTVHDVAREEQVTAAAKLIDAPKKIAKSKRTVETKLCISVLPIFPLAQRWTRRLAN